MQNRRSFLTNATLGLAAASGSAGSAEAMAEAPQETAAGERYELSNNQVSLVLDSEGRLVELTNRQTGKNYLANVARHAPWRMYYRWNTPLDGALELAIPTDGQKAQVKRNGASLEISYQTLTGDMPQSGKTRELQVGLLVRIALQGDRFTWTARIDNRESDKELQVSELWLPWIYGIGDMGMGPASDVLYWPSRGGRRVEAPYLKLAAATGPAQPTGFGSNPTWSYSDTGAPDYRVAYPYPACMQWFTFNNGEEGLYFGSHDQTLMSTVLDVASGGAGGRRGGGPPAARAGAAGAAAAERAMTASIVKFPFVKGGEAWDSEPVVVRLYRGDWHEAAKTYRAWAGTWMRKPDPPAWVRRAPGWAGGTLKGQSGQVRTTYDTLPATQKNAQAMGLNLFKIDGWNKQGFDDYYPEYTPDEAMGGLDGLKKALAEIKQNGGKSFMYTQGQLIDPGSEYYKTKGYRTSAKDIWGAEYRETYGGSGSGAFMGTFRNKWFAVACPSAPGWGDQLVSQAKMVLGFGAQGVFYDQLGGAPPYICFSEEHGHARPSLAVGPAKVKNFKLLRDAVKAHDPEAILSNELVVDCYAGWADIIHSEGIGFYPDPESFGEMFRYTFPEPIVTNRNQGPESSNARKQLGHAFSLGLRFEGGARGGQNSDSARYAARLIGLYNKHADILLEGRFVDTEGFRCDNSLVSAHAFLEGNRMAVTLWNNTDAAHQVNVIADGYQLEVAEWQDPSLSGPGQWIMPGDIAVLIFRHA